MLIKYMYLQSYDQQVLLLGVDAPEAAQTCIAEGTMWNCGAEATQALIQRIGSATVFCRGNSFGPNGELLAVCFAGREDLNQWMVTEGWAVSRREQSVIYSDEEAVARLSRRGIWRGEFTLPSLWREGKRMSGRKVIDATEECIVKGDITERGIRIYHLPGGKFYDQVEINAATGERWFCSAEEAQMQGYRPSKE